MDWKIFFVSFTKLIPRKNFFCIAKILVLMVLALEKSCDVITRLFRAPFYKEIPLFFLWRGPFQTPLQNPALASSLFSTRKSSSGCQRHGGLGEENCLGRGGVGRERKGCAKKKGGIMSF